MFLIIFTKPRIRELGDTGGYQVFMTCETLYFFFIPTFSWGRQYFAESPDGKVMMLSGEAGKALRRGEKDRIVPEDFCGEAGFRREAGESATASREVTRSSGMPKTSGTSGRFLRKCPYCGFSTTENFNYCPKCAEKLERIE